MTLPRIAAWFVFAVLAVGPAHAETIASVDAYIAAKRAALAADCPKLDFGDGFASAVNVDGNGRDDLLIDWHAARCNESSAYFCGSGGCDMEVWLGNADGGFKRLETLFGYEIDFDQPPARHPSWSRCTEMNAASPACSRVPCATRSKTAKPCRLARLMRRSRKSSASGGFRRQPRHLKRLGILSGTRKVMVRLHAQPHVGTTTDRLFETKRHFGRDTLFAPDETVKLLTRHSQSRGGFRYACAKTIQFALDQAPGVGGILHGHGVRLSVIVHKVDIEDLAVLEAENHSPVGANGNRPVASQIALQRMQPKGWKIEVLDSRCSIQRSEQIADALNHVGLQLVSIIFVKEALQPFVPNAFDHQRM